MSHSARDGRSPYDVLAVLVPDTAEPLTALDLACGDGPLLQLLPRRGQQGLHLVGVDMSPHELERARANLPPQVELRLERAQQLSLEDASVDCVLCSLALMLMDPLDPVVRSIARVLKPGGIFAALVGGDMVRGDAWEAFTGAAARTDAILRAACRADGTVPCSLGVRLLRCVRTRT